MIRRSLFPILFLLYSAAAAMSFAGCAPPNRYSWQEIERTHADALCSLPVEESQKAPAGSEGTCAPGKPLSLKEAVAVALANNPDANMARMRMQAARASIEEAQSAFWPRFGLYAEYMQGDAPSAYLFKTIDQRKLPERTDFNQPGWFENVEAGLRADVNLFDGGRSILGKKMAESGAAASEFARLSLENSLTAEVIRTWYDILAAVEFVGIAKASEETVSEQLRVMRVRFEGGGALKSDILSLEVRLARAKEDVVTAENRRSIALAALSTLLGIDRYLAIDNDDAGPQAGDVPADMAQGVALALDHRPMVRQAKEQAVRARMAVDAARSGYLPRIDFSARYYHDDPEASFDKDRENWTAAIVANWQFFDGLKTPASVKKAGAEFLQALAGVRKAEQAVRFDVQSAFLNLNAAGARLSVAEKSVAAAEESLTLVKRQYEGGSASITRYLEAELDLSRARSRRAAAYFDEKKASADVLRSLGRFSTAGTGESPGEPGAKDLPQ